MFSFFKPHTVNKAALIQVEKKIAKQRAKQITKLKNVKLPKSNKQKIMSVKGIDFIVSWKAVKNLRISVSSVDGQVKVSSPKGIPQVFIKTFVLSKLDWIKKHQLRYQLQEKVFEPVYQTGEIHFLFGKPYRLAVKTTNSRQSVEFIGDDLILYVKKNTEKEQREKFYYQTYRAEIKKIIPVAMKILDNVIDLNFYPVKEAEITAKKYRSV